MRQLAHGIILVTVMVTLTACFHDDRLEQVDFPTDSPFHAKRYALVVETAVFFKAGPTQTANTVAYGRKGDIFLVKAIELVNSGNVKTTWVYGDKGWLATDDVQFFSNREQAETAQKRLP